MTTPAPASGALAPPTEYGALRVGAHYASLVLSAMLGTLIRLGFTAIGDCAYLLPSRS